MATIAEKLNNAIVSLAFLNQTTPAATILNNHWQNWWSSHRYIAPDFAWWGVLKSFWVAYEGARLISPNRSERTPPAYEIDPTQWALALEYVQQAGEGLDELRNLGNRAEERVRELPEKLEKLQREVGEVATNMIFVTAIAGVALLYFYWGRR